MESSTESLGELISSFCEARGVPTPDVAPLLSAVEANDADSIWSSMSNLSVPLDFYEELVTAIYENLTAFAATSPPDSPRVPAPRDAPTSPAGSGPAALLGELEQQSELSLSSVGDVSADDEGEQASTGPGENCAAGEASSPQNRCLKLNGFVAQPRWHEDLADAIGAYPRKRKRVHRSTNFRSIRSVLRSRSYFSKVPYPREVEATFDPDALSPVEVSASLADGYKEWSNSEDETLVNILRGTCRLKKIARFRVSFPADTEGARDLAKRLVTVPDSDLYQECIEWSLSEWDALANRHCRDLHLRSGADLRNRFMNVLAPWAKRSPWTADEDKRLKSIALELQERNWVEISKRLGTNRLPFACLVRYRRVLCPPSFKVSWSSAEDEDLKRAVQDLGVGRWGEIALCVGNRTGQQCLHRWRRLCERVGTKKGKWLPSEVSALEAAVKAVGTNWAQVARQVEGRSEIQCREKWVNTIDKGIRKEKWTDEEDLKLKATVHAVGLGKWSLVSKRIAGRTDNQCWRRWKALEKRAAAKTRPKRSRKAIADKHPKKLKLASENELPKGGSKIQCREKCVHTIDKGIRKTKWTDEEDLKLKAAVREVGVGKWSLVSKSVVGRTDKQCWRRWKALEKRAVAKTRPKRSRKATADKHPKKPKVASENEMPEGRSEIQCREACLNIIDKGIRKAKWTDEEDLKLKAAVGEVGLEKWSLVSRSIVGRTDKQCWRRWKVLEKGAVAKTRPKRSRKATADKHPKKLKPTFENELPA